jgi:hypothetical protein
MEQMKLLLLIPVLFLPGCACLDTCVNGPKVIIEKPKLTFDGTKLVGYDEMIKALEVDMTLINKYVIDLENVLNTYKKD